MSMSYASLTAAKPATTGIAYWVNYTKLDVAGALWDAQNIIYQTLRVREMQSVATVAIAQGDSTAALPTGYLSNTGTMRDITNNGILKYKLWSDLEENIRDYSVNSALQTRKQCFYSVFDELLQFDTIAETNVTARLTYYKKPDMLAATTNETNFLTDKYSHILRSALMAVAYRQMRKSQNYSEEITQMAAYIQSANAQDDLDVHRGQELDTWA